MLTGRHHQVRLGQVVWECHQEGLGHEWKSAPNHWLPSKGLSPGFMSRRDSYQVVETWRLV